jgi:WD40 repeat protein
MTAAPPRSRTIRSLPVGFYGFSLAVVWALSLLPAAVASDAREGALPEGAVARLGTARLRAVCESIHFAADGKTLVGVDGGRLVRVWDAADGTLQETRRLPGRPERDRWSIHTTRSPDGNTLLIVEGPSLELWDIPSGKRLDLPLPKDRKRLDRFSLSDDRRLLLFAETVEERLVPEGGGFGRLEQKQNLLLWDTTTAKARPLAEDESSLVGLAISPDGKRLASSSYGKGTRAWDTATGELLWRLAGFNAERLEFTPDGRHLLGAPGGGQNAWHVWDAVTGKPSEQLRPPTVGYAWTFAVAPDGGSVVVPTRTDYVLWDLKKGKMLHRWAGANQAGKVAFAPDGRSLVTCDTILRRWDVATGKPLYADVSMLGHTAPVRCVFFTPDGRRVVSVAEDNTIRIWDVPGSKVIQTVDLGAARPDAWALSPDGATLVGVDERLQVHRWSLADGRPRKGFALPEARGLDIGLRALHIRIEPDGQTLAIAAWPRSPEYSLLKYSFSFWDLETGRLQRWGGDPGKAYQGEYSSLSPDGRLAAGHGKLYETRTGARRLRLPVVGQTEAGGVHVFSPDGRLLAAEAGGVRVWELATGRALIDFPGATTCRAAFAPDGRWFAFADTGHLALCDVRTGDVVRRRVPEHLGWDRGWASADLAFSPDGRTVASAHPDGTILVWAVPSAGNPEGRLTERDANALWDNLAQADPARAYAAVWRLRDDPEEAVRLLDRRLPPVEIPTEGEWRKLIRALDSDRSEEREAVSRRLEELGRAAEDAVRRALKDDPAPEAKRRLEAALAALEPPTWPQGEDLRAVRAVAVLEGSATPEARRVLEAWAKRGPAVRVAEASRALARWKWRTAPQP